MLGLELAPGRPSLPKSPIILILAIFCVLPEHEAVVLQGISTSARIWGVSMERERAGEG